MSYYVLRTREFAMASPASPSSSNRLLYLLKKRDVPSSEQKQILKLQCYSIQRVSGISKLMLYLNMYTSDAEHQTQPYVLKRLTWNEAIELFGFDYDTETSESDSGSESDSI
jgi:hypothetical protein